MMRNSQWGIHELHDVTQNLKRRHEELGVEEGPSKRPRYTDRKGKGKAD